MLQFGSDHQLPRGDAKRPVILRRWKELACEVRAHNNYRPRVGVISLSSLGIQIPPGDNLALASHPQMGPTALILFI